MTVINHKVNILEQWISTVTWHLAHFKNLVKPNRPIVYHNYNQQTSIDAHFYANNVHCGKVKVSEPIYCCTTTFFLQIYYFTLWPWLLTLNIYSVSPVMWGNCELNVNAIEQSATELLRFQYLT